MFRCSRFRKGLPVSIGFGYGRVAGNIVRQNDWSEGDWIKLIVCHGQGEWDEIITHYVNDIKWGELKNTNHAKWSHLGAADQSGITNIFTEDACNYRNKVISEYKIRKCDEIRTLQNINVIARMTRVPGDRGGPGRYEKLDQEPGPDSLALVCCYREVFHERAG